MIIREHIKKICCKFLLEAIFYFTITLRQTIKGPKKEKIGWVL